MSKGSATRRHFVRASASMLAGLALTSKSSFVYAATKPNSMYRGVQLGTITYSYRSMPDQSAEGLLGYVVESGISAVELMGTPAEEFAGAPRDAYFEELAQWRATAPLDGFERLRRIYEDAGVSIYAWKPDVFGPRNSDAEIEYGFRAARALGATHCTTELPDDPAQSLRIGKIAEKHGVYIAYHTHEQASITAFDEAFAQSEYNRSNVDLGHYVAAPNGGDPLAFLGRHHDRIASVHLKDRQTPANGARNLPWGQGDTPLVEILQLMRDERYAFPATIELEYAVPEGSNAVEEVRKCVEFCKAALDA
jgi:sugar phosphate isomerase/epimerase